MAELIQMQLLDPLQVGPGDVDWLNRKISNGCGKAFPRITEWLLPSDSVVPFALSVVQPIAPWRLLHSVHQPRS